MEYVHEPNSMQVFPGQFRIPIINYRIDSVEKIKKLKNRNNEIGKELEKAKLEIRKMDEFLMSKNGKISALETENTEMNTELETKTKKISALETENTEMNTELETKTKKISALQTENIEMNTELKTKIKKISELQKNQQQNHEELKEFKMEFLRSCFEYLDFCKRDKEYFSTHVHKIQDFLKSNLTALQTLYSSIYKEMWGDDLTEAGHALVDFVPSYKNDELKTIKEEVSRNDFSIIPNIMKNFAENVGSHVVMIDTKKKLKSLKDRLIQSDDVSKKDKLQIEEITSKCTYALTLLIETNFNHTVI